MRPGRGPSAIISSLLAIGGRSSGGCAGTGTVIGSSSTSRSASIAFSSDRLPLHNRYPRLASSPYCVGQSRSVFFSLEKVPITSIGFGAGTYYHFSTSQRMSFPQAASKRGRVTLMSTSASVTATTPDFVDATACSRCRGEGLVRGRPSKKARAQRKRDIEDAKQAGADEAALPPPAPPRYVPCPNCSGSGIVPLDTASDTSATSSSNIPPIRPDISVAIVGGGIGGLALALALQHRSVPCTVYERDSDFDQRSQGYGLTMQQAARAVKALGLSGLHPENNNDDDDENNNDFATTKKFGITSKRHIVHKIDGTPVGQWGLRVWGRPETKTKKEAGRQNAHVARQELRRMLLDRLKPGTVKWGHRLVSYKESSDGEDDSVHLTLSRNDDETITSQATVLVGADGIRSAVRRLKVGDNNCPLRYLDCIVILGIAPTPMGSELADGETVFQTADGTTRIYAMPFAEAGEETAGAADRKELQGRGEMMWQLSFPMDEAEAQKLSNEGPAALKAEALARCGEWHEPLPELLRSTPDHLVSGYPVYDRELLNADDLRYGGKGTNDSKSLVTLIGDAAHPMSPFKGQGANQALLDAVLLARGLYKTFQRQDSTRPSKTGETVKSIEETLTDFESEMLSRSAAKVKASADAAKFLHSEIAVAEGNHPRCTAAANLAAASEVEK